MIYFTSGMVSTCTLASAVAFFSSIEKVNELLMRVIGVNGEGPLRRNALSVLINIYNSSVLSFMKYVATHLLDGTVEASLRDVRGVRRSGKVFFCFSMPPR